MESSGSISNKELMNTMNASGPKQLPCLHPEEFEPFSKLVNSEFYNDFKTFSKLVHENGNWNDVTTNKILGLLEILAIKNIISVHRTKLGKKM